MSETANGEWRDIQRVSELINNEGKSYEEIGEQFGVDPDKVARFARRNELEKWQDPAILDQLINEEGLTYQEIANEYGTDMGVVGRFARQYDVNPWDEEYRNSPIYKGSTVGVGRREKEVEIPIPVDVVQRYDLATARLRVPTGLFRDSIEQGDIIETNEDGVDFIAAEIDGDSVDIEPANGYVPPAKFPDFGVDEKVEVKGKLVRFIPVLEDGQISLLMDLSVADRDRVYSNERRLIHRGSNYHLVAVLPRALGFIMGLHREVEPVENLKIDPRSRDLLTGRQATFGFDQDHITISFDPAIEPWDPGMETPSTTVSSLERVEEKPLHPLRIGPNAELSPETTEKYYLGLPFDYHRAYDIEVGDEVVVRLGEIDGELAIVYDLETDPATVDERIVRKVSGSTTSTNPQDFDGTNLDEDESYDKTRVVYPPKPLVHGLGLIGIDRPLVDFIPGDGYFAIQPINKDNYGNKIELYDPRKAKEASSEELDVSSLL